VVARMGVTLNEAKTSIKQARQESFRTGVRITIRSGPSRGRLSLREQGRSVHLFGQV
jgi:hypothetical protein